MDYDEYIKKLKEALKFPPGVISSSTYSSTRRQIALAYLVKGEEIEGIYNLTESHGIGLRQIGLIESARSTNANAMCYTDYLTFDKGYAMDEASGMLQRLKEMPSEWTIVQLTRQFDAREKLMTRKAETAPKLQGFHLTRLPCGQETELGCPVVVDREWSNNSQPDVIAEFWKIKKQLGTSTGSNRLLRKLRNEAAQSVEQYCREIGQVYIKEWIVLLLGTICDSKVSNWIRDRVDRVLDSRQGLSKRQKYLTYLLAAGSAHVSEQDIHSATYQLFPDDSTIRTGIIEAIAEIKREKPNLPLIRRNPVILIVDEHLDLLPWESILPLRRHPISRVPSLHFAHTLYKIHSKEIKNGLRELDSKDVCYYVLNPGGDLQIVEQRLAKFIKTRFPSWVGIVGQKPTEKQLVEALTNGNAFIYCGHGSGCQYMTGESIQRLNVKPVQLLFGCSSVSLKDHGGCVEMTGDFLQYTIAGSGCTLGMLWAVTSNDIDKITLNLANIWLPGDPIDIQTLEKDEEIKKEPELLRALVRVRNFADLYSNGAAFIARGIPIKIV